MQWTLQLDPSEFEKAAFPLQPNLDQRLCDFTNVKENLFNHKKDKQFYQLVRQPASPSLSPISSLNLGKEHIVINYTENDHHIIYGVISLIFYIGFWVGSSFLLFLTVVFFLTGFYIPGSILLTAICLCYIVPIKPNKRFRDFCRKSFGRYFKSTSVRFEHIPNPAVDRPTILCISPHGVFSLCWAHCYLTDELHHFRWCFSTLLNLSPFLRILIRLTGYPSTVQKATIIKHMQNKTSIALIPGGWHEASIHNHLKDRVYIKKRQGFIKYALHYGYTITPAYAFGERMTYSNIQGCYRLRFWLNDFGILTIIPWGSNWCPLFPRPVALHTVIGKPIELPHRPNPTPQDVHEAHCTYMRAMSDLFDRYKYHFYGRNAENCCLELW